MLVQPGDPFDADRLDRSLKTLYATGLFQDVRLSRDGDTLVVHVVENPLVNRVAFEGNHKLTDDQLAAGNAAQAARGVHAGGGRGGSPAHPRSVRQARLLRRARSIRRSSASTRTGSMWCSRSTTGQSTLISKIAFVGNHAFSEESAVRGDQQPRGALVALPVHVRPIRSGAAELRQGTAAPLLPEERLRRFRDPRREVGTGARPLGLFPDLHASAKANATGSARSTITSQLRNLTGDDLRGDLQFETGDWYDGDAVGRSRRCDGTGRAQPRLCVRRGQAADQRATATSTPSTWRSMSAKGRASMSSGSTSSATRAPRTR